MRINTLRRTTALAAFAACLCAPLPARAADPEPPVEEIAKSAAPKDTSRFLPRWLHLHGAAGVGWLASPEWMRKFYQAGQGYEAGLEIRPGGAFRMRLNGEYQALPAVTAAEYSYVAFVDGEGIPYRDTVVFEARSTGWLGSARLEAQMALTPHLWVLGGLGRGYLETGLHSQLGTSEFAPSLDFLFPGRSGWAWIGTVGTSYEFDIFGPRLSAEVRSSYLMRDLDRFQTWSIRLGWGGY